MSPCDPVHRVLPSPCRSAASEIACALISIHMPPEVAGHPRRVRRSLTPSRSVANVHPDYWISGYGGAAGAKAPPLPPMGPPASGAPGYRMLAAPAHRPLMAIANTTGGNLLALFRIVAIRADWHPQVPRRYPILPRVRSRPIAAAEAASAPPPSRHYGMSCLSLLIDLAAAVQTLHAGRHRHEITVDW